jgi:gamma-glutamyltranspeptidase/glutathione hydrolase
VSRGIIFQFLIFPSVVWSAETASPSVPTPTFFQSRNKPPVGYLGMVDSEDRDASEWGAQILRSGGNAVDAAIATAYYLSVSRPFYASLGGGGFFVYCPAPKGRIMAEKQNCTTVDMRETAPAAATRDMYIINGVEKSELSNLGALASGIPGLVDGYTKVHAKFGKLSRAKLLSRPIQVAENGFRFTGYLATRLDGFWKSMNPELLKTLTCHDQKKSRLCRAGDTVKQKDLAKVLREISKKGREGFYSGWVAKKIVEGLKRAGGIISMEDLKNYHSNERAPIVSDFQDLEIVGMPPPSSGAILISQLFSYLDEAKKTGALNKGFASLEEVHALGTAMSLAFADTLNRVGDADFVKVPVEDLLNKNYLSKRWKENYSLEKWKDPKAGEMQKTGTNTTHISVIDSKGNSVALTITNNGPYGSCFMPEGTGVVMNNEMNDFTVIPGKENNFGLVSGGANEIAPGKRPLSSMSPTIVRDKKTGVVKVVIGGQGGPNIVTATFLSLVNRYVHGMSIIDAITAPRFHHQWRPANLQLERNSFSEELIEKLNERGHKVSLMDASARLHAVERMPNGEVWGGTDPRTEGGAVAE